MLYVEGFLFIIILSQLTAVDLRGGEALGVPKAVSPPRAPPSGHGERLLPALRAKRLLRTGCCRAARLPDALSPKANSSSVCLRRLKFYMPQPSVPNGGVLRGACGLRNFELAPLRVFLSLQTETKLQPKSTIKTILQSSYIKNDNPH